MIPQGLFTQIGMVIISIVIIVSYIKPIFMEIDSMQDDISVYHDKRNSVASVNNKLDSLVSKLESISNEDRRQLLTYMPDEIDYISVVRDLFLISEEAGVLYLDSQYIGLADSGARTEGFPTIHGFSLSIEGTYSHVKTLIGMIEQNHYPLEISDLNVKQLEGGFLSVDMNLLTYSYGNVLTEGSNKVEF